jgi:hypothetical protein
VEINHDKIFFQDQSPVGALIVKPYLLKNSLILGGYSKDRHEKQRIKKAQRQPFDFTQGRGMGE